MGHRLAIRREVFGEKILTSSNKRVIIFVIIIENCHSRWAQDWHLSESFAPLAAIVALTSTECFLLLRMAGFEKSALRPLENCVFLPHLNYFSYLGHLWSHSREITLHEWNLISWLESHDFKAVSTSLCIVILTRKEITSREKNGYVCVTNHNKI